MTSIEDLEMKCLFDNVPYYEYNTARMYLLVKELNRYRNFNGMQSRPATEIILRSSQESSKMIVRATMINNNSLKFRVHLQSTITQLNHWDGEWNATLLNFKIYHESEHSATLCRMEFKIMKTLIQHPSFITARSTGKGAKTLSISEYKRLSITMIDTPMAVEKILICVQLTKNKAKKEIDCSTRNIFPHDLLNLLIQFF